MSSSDSFLKAVELWLMLLGMKIEHPYISASVRCEGKSGDSSAVGRGRADHDQQHCYHHAPKVKPEAAIAVVELLTMDVRTPETC